MNNYTTTTTPPLTRSQLLHAMANAGEHVPVDMWVVWKDDWDEITTAFGPGALYPSNTTRASLCGIPVQIVRQDDDAVTAVMALRYGGINATWLKLEHDTKGRDDEHQDN